MFTPDHNAVVKKVIGYYTSANKCISKTKPATQKDIIAVKVLQYSGLEGAILAEHIVDFSALPENCD